MVTAGGRRRSVTIWSQLAADGGRRDVIASRDRSREWVHERRLAGL